MPGMSDGTRCLPRGEIDALRSLPPDAIPAEAAAHLAGCDRCQRLMLFGTLVPTTGRRKAPPSLRRAFLLVGVVLAALVLFLVSLRILLS